MVVDPTIAFKILQEIVKKTAPKEGTNDDEITGGEIRRFLDTDEKKTAGRVTEAELNTRDMALLRYAANDLRLDTFGKLNDSEKQELKQAQNLLQRLLQNPGQLEKPPGYNRFKKLGLENDLLIRNPHELADLGMMDKWSQMRIGYADKTIDINARQGKEYIAEFLGKGNNVAALVKDFWTNGDSVEGVNTHVFRMNEMIAAWEYSKETPAFKDAFMAEMVNYINDPKSGLDKQFVLDSLLQVIQSTDFTGQKDLEGFIKELAENIADSGNFKGKNGALGNYDGTRDGGVFGSLALVRNKKGDLEWIQHDPSSQARKTKYNLVAGNGANIGAVQGAGNARPDAAGIAPGVQPGQENAVHEHGQPLIPPGVPIKNAKTAQKKLDNIKKEISKIEDPDLQAKVFDAGEKLADVKIPSILGAKDSDDIKSLIGVLEGLRNLDLPPKLAKEIDTLIKLLQSSETSSKSDAVIEALKKALDEKNKNSEGPKNEPTQSGGGYYSIPPEIPPVKNKKEKLNEIAGDLYEMHRNTQNVDGKNTLYSSRFEIEQMSNRENLDPDSLYRIATKLIANTQYYEGVDKQRASEVAKNIINLARSVRKENPIQDSKTVMVIEHQDNSLSWNNKFRIVENPDGSIKVTPYNFEKDAVPDMNDKQRAFANQILQVTSWKRLDEVIASMNKGEFADIEVP